MPEDPNIKPNTAIDASSIPRPISRQEFDAHTAAFFAEEESGGRLISALDAIIATLSSLENDQERWLKFRTLTEYSMDETKELVFRHSSFRGESAGLLPALRDILIPILPQADSKQLESLLKNLILPAADEHSQLSARATKYPPLALRLNAAAETAEGTWVSKETKREAFARCANFTEAWVHLNEGILPSETAQTLLSNIQQFRSALNEFYEQYLPFVRLFSEQTPLPTLVAPLASTPLPKTSHKR